MLLIEVGEAVISPELQATNGFRVGAFIPITALARSARPFQMSWKLQSPSQKSKMMVHDRATK